MIYLFPFWFVQRSASAKKEDESQREYSYRNQQIATLIIVGGLGLFFLMLVTPLGTWVVEHLVLRRLQ